MLLVEIFYSVFWVSAILTIWFYTDWFIHYTQLFGIAENYRLKYTSYISKNNDSYFPDFLYQESLKVRNKIFKFLLKMVSCVFCLTFWMSLLSSIICGNVLIAAPTYVISLIILLQIKKMM